MNHYGLPYVLKPAYMGERSLESLKSSPVGERGNLSAIHSYTRLSKTEARGLSHSKIAYDEVELSGYVIKSSQKRTYTR